MSKKIKRYFSKIIITGDNSKRKYFELNKDKTIKSPFLYTYEEIKKFIK